MKKLTYLALGLFAFIFVQSCQNEPGANYVAASKVDHDGIVFIQGGLEGGLTEIKASGLAATHSSNARVQSFAQMLIKDHTAAGEKLEKIKTREALHSKDSISTAHQEMIDSLSKLNGPQFDKAYLTMMVKDHEAAVGLFRVGMGNTDPHIADFAKNTLPKIETHLDSAKAILASEK